MSRSSTQTTLAPGERDFSFGTRGSCVIEHMVSPSAMAQDLNGYVYIAGAHSNNEGNFILTRMTPDGVIDTRFGLHGYVSETFDKAFRSIPSGISVSEDGNQILVTGQGRSIANQFIRWPGAARYDAKGKLDESFGLRGRVLLPPPKPAAQPSEPRELLEQAGFGASEHMVLADGKIVLCAHDWLFDLGGSVIRLNSDGRLDKTFNGTGYTNVHHPIDSIHFTCVNAQDANHIVVSGFRSIPGGGTRRTYPICLRYKEDGMLEPGFGSQGWVQFEPDLQAELWDLPLQKNNQVLLVGCKAPLGAPTEGLLAKLNHTGSFNAMFNGGRPLLSNKGYALIWWAAVEQPDSKIVAVGHYQPLPTYEMRGVIARFLKDGKPDETFGDITGIVPIPDHRQINRVALQKNGQILACGLLEAEVGTRPKCAVVRYQH
ncbi:hypothetical protein [Pseudomonas sp. dw_612]|uniref:hypothetical protein n=1 Tax=Pseudomonas sp. dw_612 TaxID=2720080 RepID=UPI001BD437F7|nr:hypothetical protein [Pseudomonas sp. dw_612]